MPDNQEEDEIIAIYVKCMKCYTNLDPVQSQGTRFEL
jgi:hypothetical protein